MTSSYQEFLRKIENLPMLPAIVTGLMQLDKTDANYFDKVADLAKEDPGMALRLIKLSNSVAMHSQQPVANIKDAAIRIGINEIHELIASVAVLSVFVPVTEGERRLWSHSIEVATLSKTIAKDLLNLNHLWQEQLYLCGLLHDVGLLVMFEAEREKLNHVDDFHWTTPAQHISAEQQVFDVSHQKLGALLCHQWNVPNVMCEIILRHHDYELPAKVQKQKTHYHTIRILQLADFISEYTFYNNLPPNRLSMHEIMYETELVPEPLKHWVEVNIDMVKLNKHVALALNRASEYFQRLGI